MFIFGFALHLFLPNLPVFPAGEYRKRIRHRFVDHAAYLGKELARAEQALLNGESFVQDAAPELQIVNEHSTELSACGCGSSCGEDKHA